MLADEINQATPKTQSALLEAMEENQITVEGGYLFLQRLPECKVQQQAIDRGNFRKRRGA